MKWKWFPLERFKTLTFDEHTENKRFEWLERFLEYLVKSYLEYHQGEISEEQIRAIMDDVLREYGKELSLAHSIAFYHFYSNEEPEEEAYDSYENHLLYENPIFGRFFQEIESRLDELLQGPEQNPEVAQ